MPFCTGNPFLIFCLFFGCLGAGGCGSIATHELPSPTEADLLKIGGAYARATAKLGRPPTNRKELIPFLDPKLPASQIFRSPNDGEDFEIVWGVELRELKAQGNDVPIVAYEKRGKEGKRYVLRGRSEALVMSEGELKSAVFPAGYKFPF